VTYDSAGRLAQVVGSTTTQYAYDGDQLLAEYNNTGLLQRRYIPGPNGQDDPVAWYEGAGATDRRWLIADQQGTVVGVTNASGALINGSANTYDEYGVPSVANLGAFQYTGQRWLPDAGLYYYKARVYSPTLGRFMQTDPAGYQSDFNWYTYAGNDPVNRIDPMGRWYCGPGATPEECWEDPPPEPPGAFPFCDLLSCNPYNPLVYNPPSTPSNPPSGGGGGPGKALAALGVTFAGQKGIMKGVGSAATNARATTAVTGAAGEVIGQSYKDDIPKECAPLAYG
jgi:RHS repeat-associated protein